MYAWIAKTMEVFFPTLFSKHQTLIHQCPMIFVQTRICLTYLARASLRFFPRTHPLPICVEST